MNLTESIKLSTEISRQLFLCGSKAEVERIFEKSKITEIPDKIGLLHLCMGIKNFSSSPQAETLTPAQQYDDLLLVFLEGSWRFLV